MIDLAQLLTSEFKITQGDLDKAKLYQSRYDGRLEQILVNKVCKRLLRKEKGVQKDQKIRFNYVRQSFIMKS